MILRILAKSELEKQTWTESFSECQDQAVKHTKVWLHLVDRKYWFCYKYEFVEKKRKCCRWTRVKWICESGYTGLWPQPRRWESLTRFNCSFVGNNDWSRRISVYFLERQGRVTRRWGGMEGKSELFSLLVNMAIVDFGVGNDLVLFLRI